MPIIENVKLIPALLLSLFTLSCLIQEVAAQASGVDEHQIEVKLVPDKATIMLGEPIYLSFIVENNSNLDLQVLVGGDYRNALGRPESFKVTVMGKDGRPVSQPDAG